MCGLSHPQIFSSSLTFSSLAGIERQAKAICLECDNRAFWEIKHVSFLSRDLLLALTADLELAVQNDFHLMISVCVDQRFAGLETEYARGDWLLDIVFGSLREP